MIILASSSPTRAQILKEHSIDFKQIAFDFDESRISKQTDPHKYVLEVVKSKKEQFLSKFKDLDKILFADSCVFCNGHILTKAVDDDDAIRMLNMQSQNEASVITAMIFLSKKFELICTSRTTYKFDKFIKDDLDGYIKSKEYMGKAGAMMIEGFNKKYILSQEGTTSNARGLNAELLKAFL